MPKGYWIARVDVRDPEGYKDYVAAAKVAFEKHGAVFLARGGAYERLEGEARGRNVVIEFPSLQAAVDCYNPWNTRSPPPFARRWRMPRWWLSKGSDTPLN